MTHKIKILLLLLLLALGKTDTSFASGVVHDPAHMASNFLGFLNSLENAIKQSQIAFDALQNGKTTFETIKKMKEAVEKVNKVIYNLRAIKEAGENLVYITKYTKETYQMAFNSGYFSISELTRMLDTYTYALIVATASVNTITEYCSSDKWKFSDKERKDEIEQTNTDVEKIKENIAREARRIHEQIRQRKLLDELNKNQLLSPFETFYMYRKTGDIELLPAMEYRYLFRKLYIQETPVMDENTAKTSLKNQTSAYVKLFYALSAIICLLGIYKVFTKIQLGSDDVVKSIYIWFGGALFLYIIAQVIPTIF